MYATVLQTAIMAMADRRGVTALEYGIIAAVLAIGLAASFTALTGRLSAALSALVF
jgi:Flp pilus assembly pilin Flp